MKVAIRADASVAIGTGHIMRCLTLAEELRARGSRVVFFCVASEGNLIDFIRDKGYSCVEVKTADALIDMDGDWLVVDHYSLGEAWEANMRAGFKHIFVIDDLANRRHNCDFLLDQNLFPASQVRYACLVPAHCRLFCGPNYALLRKEFWEAKRVLHKDYSCVKTILVSFGGTDPTHETLRFLSWWSKQDENAYPQHLVVVIGKQCLDKKEVLQLGKKIENIEIHVQTDKMAQLICSADISVGAGGITIWERCYLGLPSAVVVVAENQRQVSAAAAAAGVVLALGEKGNADFSRIRDLIDNKNLRETMVAKMAALFPDNNEYMVSSLVKAMEAELNDEC